jgi:rRNA maturation endonuclease Nob1
VTDFGACKSCGRVYSLTRLKACPRCGDVETASIEEVRIPPTTRKDFSYSIPKIEYESSDTDLINNLLPTTTPCENCGRDFRSDKLSSCPRCGHQQRISDPESSSISNKSKSGSEFRCALCNKTFSQTFDFCPSCGARVQISAEQQIVEKFVMPLKVEPNLVKSQSQSIPLSEQRQAKNRKLRSTIFSTLGVFTLLIFAVLIFKNISSGTSNSAAEVAIDSPSYSQMYTIAVNFAKVSGPSDSAESQCTSAKSTGLIKAYGRPLYLGQQARWIQSLLATPDGFQGCIDGFNSF